VQEKTIMKIGEWKTRSVFDRYNTVDEKGLADLQSNLIAKAQQRKLRHTDAKIQREGREQQR
jgi:hypothetical protein